MTQREYKGRRIDTNEWVYGWYIRADLGPEGIKHVIQTDNGYHDDIDPETVGQYTAVHDGESDNRLFEGDNIRMEYEGEKVTGNIQYCGGGFLLASDDFEDGFMWLSDLTENDGAHFWIPTAELIGNRWDHPHLLKGEG